VRVTGTVIERNDLPAFVPRPNEPLMQGIPVASESELPRARHRYLLANASWTVVR
jgi:hypothetical protein